MQTTPPFAIVQPSPPTSSKLCVAVDGDTLSCLVVGGRVHLRLNGIDTPELPGHCRAGRKCVDGDPIAAKANMAALIRTKTVRWIPLGHDIYKRTIAEVRVGRTDVQCEQLKGNFAVYVAKWDNRKTLAKRCGKIVAAARRPAL